MLKYCMAAAALKTFSYSTSTRKLYRWIGNTIGGRSRVTSSMPSYYAERVQTMLRLASTYASPKNGDRIIELGTGWLHWEAITARLFFDVHGTLLDVWDNRHLQGLKHYLGQLDALLDSMPLTTEQRSLASGRIAQILAADDFDHVYQTLGFQYVIDPTGTLDVVARRSYDLVVSGGVLEHISADGAAAFVEGIAAILKPGGYSIHSINIRDHLFQYDSTVSPKQYLKYSDRVWRRYFDNSVQYINRIQRSEWLRFFSAAGLELIEEDSARDDLSGLHISSDYARFERSDLECGGLRIVHRRPLI